MPKSVLQERRDSFLQEAVLEQELLYFFFFIYFCLPLRLPSPAFLCCWDYRRAAASLMSEHCVSPACHMEGVPVISCGVLLGLSTEAIWNFPSKS